MGDFFDQLSEHMVFDSLKSLDALRRGHCGDNAYFRNPIFDANESLCRDCLRILQEPWFKKSIHSARLRDLQVSWRRCDLCYLFLSGLFGAGLDPTSFSPGEASADQAVWATLKPSNVQKFKASSSSVEPDQGDAETARLHTTDAANLSADNILADNAEDGENGELDPENSATASPDAQGKGPAVSKPVFRELCEYETVVLTHVDIGLQPGQTINDPFPPYGESFLVEETSDHNSRPIIARFDVNMLQDGIADILQATDRPNRLLRDDDTGSEQRMALARTWLRQCDSTHEHCPKISTTAPLPARVIDVGSDDRLDHPFLYESTGQVGSYAALSHRWGDKPVTTTGLKTLGDRCRALPLASLPLTFRHAIQTTRALGFQYLWIDSLCIVQDSILDWDRESKKMGQIYENAAITFAALDAEDAESGLYVPIPGRVLKPCFLGTFFYRSHPKSGGGESVRAFARRKKPRHSGYEVSLRPRGALDDRGWVLQEELLSARFLSFTQSGLFWECQHSEAAEEHPEGCLQYETRYDDRFDPSRKYARVFRRTMSPAADAAQDHWARVPPLSSWRSLVADFTLRAFTRDSDVVVAIKGIADAIGRLIEDEHVLGLWRGQLVNDLLWHVDMGREDWQRRTYGRPFGGLALWSPTGYRTPALLPPPHRRAELQVPSWSWMKSKHPISWERSRGGESMVEILDLQVTPDGHNKYTGRIVLEGCLYPVFAIPREPEAWETLANPTDHRNRAFRVNYDDVTWEDPRAVCLPIAQAEAPSCLVLYPAAQVDAQGQWGYVYHRIGVATWNRASWDWLASGIEPAAPAATPTTSSQVDEDTATPGAGMDAEKTPPKKPDNFDAVDWSDIRFCAGVGERGIKRRITIV